MTTRSNTHSILPKHLRWPVVLTTAWLLCGAAFTPVLTHLGPGQPKEWGWPFLFLRIYADTEHSGLTITYFDWLPLLVDSAFTACVLGCMGYLMFQTCCWNQLARLRRMGVGIAWASIVVAMVSTGWHPVVSWEVYIHAFTGMRLNTTWDDGWYGLASLCAAYILARTMIWLLMCATRHIATVIDHLVRRLASSDPQPDEYPWS